MEDNSKGNRFLLLSGKKQLLNISDKGIENSRGEFYENIDPIKRELFNGIKPTKPCR